MRKSFLIGKSWKASKRFQLIHADFCESMQSMSFGGSRYFLIFDDDYNRMS